MSGYLQKPASGGVGGGTWGSITGTLSNQTDLQNALNLKYDASNPAGYITASSIPTNISAFTNDVGFITSSALSGYLQNNVGISGGTTLIGGTASGNNLTLVSTSHATKGKILFGTSAYDEVNKRLGIGTNTPTAQVHLKGVSGVNNGLTVESPDANPIIRVHTGTTSVNRRPCIAFSSPSTEWAVGFITSDNKFRIAQGGDLGTDASCAMAIDKTTYNFGFRVVSPTAKIHIAAGTASAGSAPLKFTSGTNLTTPEVGAVEYNNTFHVTNSDATRRHVVTAPNTTKVTASAPYTNDGYITINIGGTDFKVMTTA